jgi:hypothetical protein
VRVQFQDFVKDFGREESEFAGLDWTNSYSKCGFGGDEWGIGGCGTAGGGFEGSD